MKSKTNSIRMLTINESHRTSACVDHEVEIRELMDKLAKADRYCLFISKRELGYYTVKNLTLRKNYEPKHQEIYT